MKENPIPQNSLDEIMYRIRQEVAQRNPQFDNNSSIKPPSRSSAHVSLRAEQHLSLELPEHDNRIQEKSTYLLSDFLRYHDEDFVTNAYYGILQRPPDAKGLNDFLKAYRDGTLSPLEILGRLRFSKEGREHGVRVRGLFPRFAIRTLYHIPLLGYLIALAVGIARLPIILKQLQQFKAFTVTRQNQQIQSINASVGQLSIHERSLRSLDMSKEELAATKKELDMTKVGLDTVKADLKKVRAELETATAQLIGLRSTVSLVDHKISDVAGLKADAAMTAELGMTLGALMERIEKIEGSKLDSIAFEQERRALEVEYKNLKDELLSRIEDRAEKHEIIEVLHQIANQKRNLLDQDRRLNLLLEEARKRLPEPIGPNQIEHIVSEEQHLMDSFYIAFEDRFRGTSEDIKHRLAIYLPLVISAGASTALAPVLDLGCGRGEWLELLRDQGIAARGVDLNRVMLTQCRDIGLDVIEADALDYLRSLARNSLSAVTAMHLVEHIAFRRLIALFDEVMRVLKPGGIVIFETPNPENLKVGACNFYLDPTHLHPIPPDTLQYTAEARGFVRSRIERLNANLVDNPFAGLRDFTPQRDVQIMRTLLEDTYFAPPDYALIAQKA